MTKPITAVATMILLEECVVRLDEPVDRFLPELADRRVVRRMDGRGRGFGVGVVTRRDHPAPVGQYGWDGGLGSLWRNDPSEQLVTILLTNAARTAPSPPDVALDFLTAAYAAIDH